MSRQSSHTIQYKDLLELSEEVLSERERWYAGARARGTTNLDALSKKVQTAKTLVRMLKKGLPGRQSDFLELFQKVNR